VTGVLVRGGRIVDETGERAGDVRVRDGWVAEVGVALAADGERELDAGGCLVSPGLVDLHAHLREPGHEEAETIETASRAAALGGFTALVAMPNTEPPLDDAAVVRSVLDRGAQALCDVTVAGCLTKGRRGSELGPLGELHGLGVRIFTDDGACVGDGRVMRRALEYASALPGAVVAQHAEDPALAEGGHMHEGEWSSRLGIPGRPGEAESVIVARDLDLVRRTRTRYHVLHLSTAAAVDLVRRAKAEGLPVTAEATPHHFTLTDAECASFDPAFKVHPPLRSQSDVDSIAAGIADGTIDAIATDHAPHAPETKEQPFEDAPPGMLGLETAAAVAITSLVETQAATFEQVAGALSWRPAAIAGLSDHGGPIKAGRPANLCVIDPAAAWQVDIDRLASRSRNTPWLGRKLAGRVRHTIRRGEAVVVDAEAQR